MARMKEVVLGRRLFVKNNVTLTVGVRTRLSLGVRVGLALIKLGAWICGISVKEEEADNDLV